MPKTYRHVYPNIFLTTPRCWLRRRIAVALAFDDFPFMTFERWVDS